MNNEMQSLDYKHEKIKITSAEIITRKIPKEMCHGESDLYYELKYKVLGEDGYHVGYSSYCINNVFSWFKEYFVLVDENEESNNGWISVNDRLPECEYGYESDVIMFQLSDTNTIEIGVYGCGGKLREQYFRNMRSSTEGVDLSDVVAWMPLPKAYEGE